MGFTHNIYTIAVLVSFCNLREKTSAVPLQIINTPVRRTFDSSLFEFFFWRATFSSLLFPDQNIMLFLSADTHKKVQEATAAESSVPRTLTSVFRFDHERTHMVRWIEYTKALAFSACSLWIPSAQGDSAKCGSWKGLAESCIPGSSMRMQVQALRSQLLRLARLSNFWSIPWLLCRLHLG